MIKNLFYMQILKTFLILLFVHASVGVILECKYVISEWTTVGQAYYCDATFVCSGSQTIVESVRGSHALGKSHFDVNAFMVENKVLKRLYKGIENFFPNIIAIHIENSRMEEINADDLKPFLNMTRLTVPSNKLVSIDGDLFKFTPKMQFIHFQNNLIEYVQENLLSNLNFDKIIDVNFANNVCINIDADTPQKIKQLIIQLQGCSSQVMKKNSLFEATGGAEKNDISKCMAMLEVLINKTLVDGSKTLVDNAKLETELRLTKIQLEELKSVLAQKEEEIAKLQSRFIKDIP